MPGNQPDRDRSGADKWDRLSVERDGIADEREDVADERELGADHREHIADDRDLGADDREHVADERDSVADDRELRADDRDGSDILAEQHADAAGRRQDETVGRVAALGDRESASAERDDAATGRRVDAAGRGHRLDEAMAVGAHLALNSSAVVVMGISMLKAHWPRMGDPDRVLIVDRVHVHAHAVDKTLRRYITGESG